MSSINNLPIVTPPLISSPQTTGGASETSNVQQQTVPAASAAPQSTEVPSQTYVPSDKSRASSRLRIEVKNSNNNNNNNTVIPDATLNPDTSLPSDTTGRITRESEDTLVSRLEKEHRDASAEAYRKAWEDPNHSGVGMAAIIHGSYVRREDLSQK